MNLIKDNWTIDDKKEVIKYLESIQNKDKILWTKKIVNTNMKVLAIKTDILNKIVKEISKGNYISFLDLNINDYYENTIINAGLICKIKDFNLMKKYLNNYVNFIDNWSSCDTLKFNVKNNEKKFFSLSKKYIKSKEEFTRRVGIIILFKLIDDNKYLPEIFKIFDGLIDEKKYYVNMACAWLLCECFIKYREETIKYFKTNKTNSFIINKSIQKCRDSLRVTKEDKEYLLKFKIK